MTLSKLKSRVIPRQRRACAPPLAQPDDGGGEVILKRVKVRNFSQARAVASKLLKELANGRLPVERVRGCVSLLQIIVSANQNILLRARLQRIEQTLQMNLDGGEQTGEPEDVGPDEDALESAEPDSEMDCESLDSESDDDEERDSEI